MKRINAVIEKAEICKIGDPFLKKPPDLGLTESDALMVNARTVDGRGERQPPFTSVSSPMEPLRKALWEPELWRPGDADWHLF